MTDRPVDQEGSFPPTPGSDDTAEQLRTLVEAVGGGIFRLDADGRFVAVDDAIVETTGYARDDLLGRHVSMLFDDADSARFGAAVRLLLGSEEEDATALELTVRDADGRGLPCECRFGLLASEAGFRGTIGVVRELDDGDRIERRRETMPRTYESVVNDVFDEADVGVVVLDADGHVAWMNRTVERYFGLDWGDVIGRNGRALLEEIREVVTDPKPFEESVSTAPGGDTPVERFECRVTAGDDREERWIERRSEPIESGRYAGGRVELFYDVTRPKERSLELERQRDEIREELERYETIVEAIPDGAYVLDESHRFRLVNDAFCELTGYDREELLGEDVEVVSTDRRREREEALREELRADETDAVLEKCIETADGDVFDAEIRFDALYDEDGDFRGMAGVVRDVSERKGMERELRERERRFRTLAENLDEVVWMTSSDPAEFLYINPAFEAVWELDRETLYDDGLAFVEDVHPEDRERVRDAYTDLPEAEYDEEYRVVQSDGTVRWIHATAVPVRNDDGEVERIVGIADDVTERKEHEEYLREAKTQLEAAAEAGAVGTWEWRIPEDEMVTGASFARTFGVDPDAAREGVPLDRFVEAIHEDDRARVERAIGEAIESCGDYREEYRVWDVEGELRWVVARGHVECDEDGDPVRFPGALVDISERKEFERTLRALHDSARGFLGATTEGEVCEIAVDAATGVLDLPCVVAYRHDRDRELLVPKADAAGSGFPSRTFPALPVGGDSITAEVFREGKRRHYDDLVDSPRLCVDAGHDDTRSGLFVPMGDHGVVVVGDDGSIDERTRRLVEILAANAESAFDRVEREQALAESERRYRTLAENFPNGGVGMYDRDLRYTLVEGRMWEEIALDPEDLEGETVSKALPPDTAEDVEPLFESALEGETDSVVSSLGGRTYRVWATPLRDARGEITAGLSIALDLTEQIERERELKRQQERLAALNELNGVVRRIADAVIDQSTREEVERTVCEALADSDSYRFAWVGDVDRDESTVTPQVAAGIEEGYLEEIEIATDEGDPTGRGPTGRAVRDREPQFWSNVLENPEYEPWHEAARERGYRSSAAIPIQHEGALYGVLNVYTDRETFEDEERTVIAQLGGIVGHAIAAVERKRALMSEDVIEVEFRVRDVFGSIDVPATDEGRIAFERTIPLGDGEFLQYGTATADAIGAVEALAERRPHWEEVEPVREGSEEVRFALRLSEPPMLSTVAALGGSVEDAVIEDGDYGLTVHLPRGEDLRRLIDAVREEFPDAKVLAQRQASRRDAPSDRVKESWIEGLTDRQRRVLETAYFAGYFEWPRNSSGDEIADTLGISPPTFHEHLRTAENKLLGALLE